MLLQKHTLHLEISQAGAELPVDFLQETEKFYRKRASASLKSVKRCIEAQMGPTYDSELSARLHGVVAALKSIGEGL